MHLENNFVKREMFCFHVSSVSSNLWYPHLYGERHNKETLCFHASSYQSIWLHVEQDEIEFQVSIGASR
jgi:hypothetical protein